MRWKSCRKSLQNCGAWPRQPDGVSRSLLRRLGSGVLSGFAFLAGLAATAALITAQTPPRFVPVVTPKLDHLAETRGRYDTLVVGSSRLFHHVNAPLFDEETQRLGEPTRTFNLGVEGMRPPETFHTLRRALVLGLPLRFVLLELWDIDTRLTLDFATVVRVIHWHDPQHTWTALRHTVSTGDTLPEKALQIWIQARAFAQQNISVGRGAELLRPLISPTKPWREPRPWESSGGFLPQPFRVMPAAEETAFLRAVERTRERGLPARQLEPALVDELRSLAREVHAAGARLVLVIPPSVEPGDGSPNLAALGIEADLLAFNDPARTPRLFEPSLHTDPRHLNERGAAEFTRMLAADFARLVAPAR